MQQYGIDLRLLHWIISSTGRYPQVPDDLKKIKRLDNRKVDRSKSKNNEKLPAWLIEREGDFSLIGEMTGLKALRLRNIEIEDYSFLPKCKSLQSLDMKETNFADCSLLIELPSLKNLSLPIRRTLKNVQILEALSVKVEIEIDEPYYHDEDFTNIIIVNGNEVALSYEGSSQVKYVEVDFHGEPPALWKEQSHKGNHWPGSNPEITEQLVNELVEAIKRNMVQRLLFSLEPWGEDHFLAMDFACGWAALFYEDLEEQVSYSYYNNHYNTVEILAPVSIGGQTPIPKMFALEDMELAGEITKHFLLTGQLYPAAQWKKEG